MLRDRQRGSMLMPWLLLRGGHSKNRNGKDHRIMCM